MPGQSHFNPFNKDTRDLFMLCIVFMRQLSRALFYYCCSLFIIVVCLFSSLFNFHSLFDFCSRSILLLFIHSLFVVQKRKDSILILGCIPGILIPLYMKCCTRIPSPSMQVNKHHTSDCTDFVLV
jgi:hypothetical protein